MHYTIDHDPIDGGHLVIASGELDVARLEFDSAQAPRRPGSAEEQRLIPAYSRALLRAACRSS